MATGRIGVTPTLGTRWSKAPAGGTTSLSGLDDNSVSLVYSVGYEQVYRNGVLLSRGNDYTATTGNSITLIDATIAGDIIEVFANELVPLTDAISKGQFTAKGALLSATAASTPAVLTVGSNDQVLTADSSTATGLKWATPVSGSMTQLATGTLSGTEVTISSISGSYKNLYLLVTDPSVAGGGNNGLRYRLNGNSNNIYSSYVINASGSAIVIQQGQPWLYPAGANGQQSVPTGSDKTTSYLIIKDYASTMIHPIEMGWTQASDAATTAAGGFGNFNSATAITSVTVAVSTTNTTFDAGTYTLYGVN